jgi:hypothetical protein
MTKNKNLQIRKEWLEALLKIAEPVITHGANGTLKKTMPIKSPNPELRSNFSHLEACGRTLAGISPWLELQDISPTEMKLQTTTKKLCQDMLGSITNPKSEDFLNFCNGRQPLVDAAHLALAIIRAPNALWNEINSDTKKNIIIALNSSRRILPHYNNWLLFSAIIETFFYKIKQPYDATRIDYALRQIDQWYVGDGFYSDGPSFHMDYYNSLVIHPFSLTILDNTKSLKIWSQLYPKFLKRAQRYSEILERMVSPEGTIPVIGRSLSYKSGALHILGHLVLKDKIEVSNLSGIKSAMDKVITKQMIDPNSFDAKWLGDIRIEKSEQHISTGSLYICCLAFLPLGLSEKSAFWQCTVGSQTSEVFYNRHDLSLVTDKSFDEK